MYQNVFHQRLLIYFISSERIDLHPHRYTKIRYASSSMTNHTVAEDFFLVLCGRPDGARTMARHIGKTFSRALNGSGSIPGIGVDQPAHQIIGIASPDDDRKTVAIGLTA